MGGRWWRAYNEACDDPKLQKLPSDLFKAWFNVMCVLAKHDGKLPPIDEVAFYLRCSVKKSQVAVDKLTALGLLNWDAQTEISLRPPTDVWAKLRALVFSRDDYTCTYCGERGKTLECDHIVPIARGGNSEIENLTTACFGCNRSKRDKLVSEWRQ